MAIPTRAELVIKVKRLLLQNPTDTANDLFPDASIQALIESARSFYMRRLNHDQFKTSAYVDATAADIAAPSDLLANFEAVFIPSGGSTSTNRTYLQLYTAEELDQRRAGWRAETGSTPTGYIMNLTSTGTFTITLVPTLDSTVPNGLFYRYTKLPTALSTDNSQPPELAFFPELWETAYPYWVCSQILFFEGGEKDERAMSFDNFVENKILPTMHRCLRTIAHGRPTWR